MTPFDSCVAALRSSDTPALFKALDAALKQTVGHKLFTLLYVAPERLVGEGSDGFAGLVGRRPISFVAVDEEGTEAAAATAVISNAPAPPPPKPVEFRADRPFLFLIRDSRHDTILFMGRYGGPDN
mgnify:CR=1 FL=1